MVALMMIVEILTVTLVTTVTGLMMFVEEHFYNVLYCFR
jgi:hypothetical protein